MRKVAFSEVVGDLSKDPRLAEQDEIVITQNGKPAGILIGFESEDDWLDYLLENDPRFLRQIASARQSIEAGRGVRIEDLEFEEGPPGKPPAIACIRLIPAHLHRHWLRRKSHRNFPVLADLAGDAYAERDTTCCVKATE
jgi:PHD/YefM family antitoxin component YafN of YafNO toxin-antitoxin module